MPAPAHLLKLLSNLMSGKGLTITTTVEENGQSRQVEQFFSNLSPEDALKKLDIIVEQQWPDENALPQRLEDFRKLSAPVDTQPKDLKTRFDQHPEEMKQRLNYSKQYYQAMRPVLLKQAQQSKRWDDLEKDFLGVEKTEDIDRHIMGFRFGHLLMETDDSKESRNFNEKIMALFAVANGRINWDEFQERRRQSGIKAGMSEEAAEKAAELERNYGMDALVDIYKDRVNKAYAKMGEARKAAGMLASGRETDPEKLADACTLVHDEGVEMMFVATSAFAGFAGYVNNYAQRKKELAQQAQDIENLSTELKPVRSVADESVSPHYAYLDPVDLLNIHLFGVQGNESLCDYITETTTTIFQGMQENARPTLEKYGFPDDIDMDCTTTDMLVYHRGRYDTLLIGVDDLGLERGLRMKLNEHVPGRYVDAGLEQDMKRLLEQYRAAAGEKPSDAFAAIGAALNDLSGDSLGEKAEAEDRNRIGKKLRGLQKAAADYLAAGNDFVITGDEACSDLAKAVKEFADKKLGQLDLVDRHIYAVQQQAAKEEWEKDTYQRFAQTVATGELDAAMYGEESAMDQQFRSEGNLKFYIEGREMKYVSPSDAAVTGSAFEDFEVQNDKINKDIVAANVVQELLNSEEKLFPNPKDRRMLRQLSSSNKVDALVHMVRESESFFENVRALDLSRSDARDKLLRDGVHKQVAKDIMKAVIRQHKAANSQPQQAPKEQQNAAQKQANKNLPGFH